METYNLATICNRYNRNLDHVVCDRIVKYALRAYS